MNKKKLPDDNKHTKNQTASNFNYSEVETGIQLPEMNQTDSDEHDDLEDIINGIINEVDQNKFKNVVWWMSIHRRDRFISGDVLYHDELDRFGIFVGPSY